MKKILLVDDVKLLLEIQKKFLASSQVQVLTACNGIEALEIIRLERPDLIILDKYMPNMDGLTCCKAIKADPLSAHIPVIISSNATRAVDMEEYRLAGCVEILAKPIDGKVFLNAIKRHLPEIERRGDRIALDMPMKVQLNGVGYDAKCENMSYNGTFAVAAMEVAVNEEVLFTFLLPKSEVPTEIKGRVVWQRKTGGGSGFGVEFMEVIGQGISILRKHELKSFVASLVATTSSEGKSA